MELWISRKIIAAHGGQLNFYCDTNGSNPKFIVDLPIISNHRKEEISAEYHHQPNNNNNNNNNYQMNNNKRSSSVTSPSILRISKTDSRSWDSIRTNLCMRATTVELFFRYNISYLYYFKNNY